jgi:hypothetical protein
MERKIPEVEAREILNEYEGSNNVLLDYKRKFVEVKNFKLTRPQSEYVIKYKDTVPKVARKHINIVSTFGEKLMEEMLLPTPPIKYGVKNYYVSLIKLIIFGVKYLNVNKTMQCGYQRRQLFRKKKN